MSRGRGTGVGGTMRGWRCVIVVGLGIALASCPAARESSVQGPAGGGVAAAARAEAASERGFVLRLSEGRPAAPVIEAVKVAAGTTLGEREVAALLARVAPLQVMASAAETQVLRPTSVAPPRAGARVLAAFPPVVPIARAPVVKAKAPVVTAPAAVRVVEHTGTSEYVRREFNVVFSAPMAADAVPATISPAVAGQWRWVSPTELVFQPAVMLPGSTKYVVTFAPGLKSLAGAGLARGSGKIAFATPRTALDWQHPDYERAMTRPDIVLLFNQRVDAAATLAYVHVTAEGGAEIPVDLVAREDAVLDGRAKEMIDADAWVRTVIVRPRRALPAGAKFTVTLAKGLPSREGPLRSTRAQSFDFSTYGALAVDRVGCDSWREECTPGESLVVDFTNPIDAKTFKSEWVTVRPEIPGMTVTVKDDELVIAGRTAARTSYSVRVDAALRDITGDTLGAAVERKVSVGSADKWFAARSEPLTVLDPAAGGKLAVKSRGYRSLDVRVYAVTPADWDAYLTGRGHRWEDPKKQKLPGKQVFAGQVAVAGDPDAVSETRLDLGPAIRDGIGQAIVVVSPTVDRRGEGDDEYVERATTWVQATRIGLDAFADEEKLVAFASGLADGKPLAGVRLELESAGIQATSDGDGLAKFKLTKRGSGVLVARLGEDVAFLPRYHESWFGDEEKFGWQAHATERLRWHAFTDRGIYRAGETVRVKGWLRRTLPEGRGLALPGAAVREVRYALKDLHGKRLLGGTCKLSALGGFDLKLVAPATPGLGTAVLELEVVAGKFRGERHSLEIEVGEFRRPQYEVSVQDAGGPYFLGGHADLTATANYYGGGSLARAEVEWTVRATQGSYAPPGRDEYVFGRRRSDWWRASAKEIERRVHSGTTNSKGEHHLAVDFTGDESTGPVVVLAEAVVKDVNRQGWAMDRSVLVHPASVYVGLRSERAYGRAGAAVAIDALAVDLDGEVVRGREIVLRAVPTGWWEEEGAAIEVCRKTSGEVAVRCSFTPKQGGSYRIAATVTDTQGRASRSEMDLWISGDEPGPRAVEAQVVTLVPDRRTYAVGDTAKLLVMAPFAPAEGVLTIHQSGIVETRRVALRGRSETIEVPVREAFAPAVEVRLDVVGAVPRFRSDGTLDPGLPPRPAYGSGAATLEVPPKQRALDLTLKPGESELGPGGKTTLEVQVRDAKGAPVVGGEVVVVVVDEAVLALTDHRIEDPLAVFYAREHSRVQAWHGREAIELADVAAAREAAEAQEGSGESRLRAKQHKLVSKPERPERAGPRIRVRRDFDALALFAAELPTDASGRARVKVELPDNLTRYRVTAVAVAGGDRFGIGETAITARLPLLVRPSPPRFLHEEDRFELPVIVQNNTGAPLTVDVAARVDNLDLTEGAGRRVAVPANDRVEVRLPATTVRVGAAQFQFAAAGGGLTDAAVGGFPVLAPPTSELAVVRGELDAGAVVVPVVPPGDASARSGGLELSLAATALAELTDAAVYLLRYPHECNEQIASRMLAMMTLRDVLGAFATPGVPRERELVEFLRADIERLRTLQGKDGAWGFWTADEAPAPFLTVHVAHALARAREKGHAVPEATLEKAKWALEDIEKLLGDEVTRSSRRAVVAYALYVRQRLGDRDEAAARQLYAAAPLAEQSFETLAWLLPVLGDSDESRAILRRLRDGVRERDGAAHFTEERVDGYWLLYADLRADAVILEALLAVDPRSDLIPKLVRGLLAGRRDGRWSSTQDNVFALLALERYFQVHEQVKPEFVARAWYGGASAGEHAFTGRTAAEQRTVVAMPELLRAGAQELVLAKDGPGRLYWRVALQHAPKGPSGPQDRGFVVGRVYEAVDDPGDVRRDADGTWRIRAGARVRVALSVATSTSRSHVALVDPLPAGLEAVDPQLATSSVNDETSASGGGDRYWHRRWYDHDSLRDDRVEVFAARLAAGVHAYTYTARATTPGSFAAPPTHASEMYAPATSGRGAGERVVVE